MATESQKKRKELREKRLAAEKQAKGQDTRQNAVKAIAAVAFLAVIVVIVVIVVAVSGGGGDDGTKSSGEIEKLFAGIPQDGITLGEPGAKATLVEFGDLQCPACKDFADNGLPVLIKDEIRPGRAKIEFLNWPILGPDSTIAGKAALAASLQGRYWQFLEYFYANQGAEGTGYITDEFLTDIAEQAGVPDIDKWNEDRNLPRWEDEIVRNDEQAVDLGFTGTPSFALRKPDGSLEPIQGSSIDDLKKAIQQAQ